MPRGLFGTVRSYQVLTADDHVIVTSGAGVKRYDVDGLVRFLEGREGHVRLGWGKLPDFEVIYLYDRRDGFGYAMNLDAPELSEWGYAPMRRREG